MISDRAFIFHMFIPWGKTLLCYQSQGHPSRSLSNTKVTFFENMTVAAAYIFHKYILFILDFVKDSTGVLKAVELKGNNR